MCYMCISLQALELKPDDQHCLVTRSKCYLQVGNAEASLVDAENALEQNKQLIKVKMMFSIKNVMIWNIYCVYYIALSFLLLQKLCLNIWSLEKVLNVFKTDTINANHVDNCEATFQYKICLLLR